jgi:hypothetical protein
MLSFNGLMHAQTDKVLHQTFSTETTDEVALNIAGNYTVETWAGMDIMTETHISIQTKNRSILDSFIKEGRYEVEAKSAEKSLELFSKKKNRGTISTSQGLIAEEVTITIYVPEEFDIIDNNKLVRKPTNPEQMAQQTPTPNMPK